MKEFNGWWVPDHVGPVGSYVRRAELLFAAVDHWLANLPRVVAVQAGGHVGVVPKGLATRFPRVYTWEPELRNFQCLVRNTEALDGIFPARGCLGNARGCAKLNVGKGSGGHQTDGVHPGTTPVYRVDDLGLDACELVCIDTEGYEIEILRGAEETLRKFSPLVIAEENRKMGHYGRKPGELADFLTTLGYRQVGAVDEDLVFEVPR